MRFQKHLSNGAQLLAAASLVASAQQSAAQSYDPQKICADNNVVGNFKKQMREWSLKQILLLKLLRDGDERDSPQWMAQSPRMSPGHDGIPGIEKGWTRLDKYDMYACEADFEFRAADPFNRQRTFQLKRVVYTISDFHRADGGLAVKIQELPESINTDTELLSLKDRLFLAGRPLSDFIKSAQAAPTPAPKAPTGNVDAFKAWAAQVGKQYEDELRGAGFGADIDAEKARRAALTPAQRAEEDEWNRGPSPGETICRKINGILRCKSG